MSEAASTLHCPSCGAPAAPGAARCVYCRTRLATIGCHVCMAQLFEGAAFCPSCGTARSRTGAPEPHSTKCPACGSGMHWLSIGGIDLLECTECDGTWLEAAAFETLCATRAQQAAIANSAAVGAGPAEAPGRAAPIRYRPCPQCGKMMNRQNFARLSGAIVDTCAGHGTFLDRGELHQVVRFVLDGGLDRARRAEIERLREEQQRLKDLELHLARQRVRE